MNKLYIENQLIELDKDVKFSLNKQFENLDNPTQIINDYSKTISIPNTKNNNIIFGNIFNPDRITVVVPENLIKNKTPYFYTATATDWNNETCSFTYENTGVYFSIYGCSIQTMDNNKVSHKSIFTVTNTGSFNTFFTKEETDYYIRIQTNASPFISYVYFDISDLINGTKYFINFNITELTTKKMVVSNFVLSDVDTNFNETELPQIGIHFNPLKKLDFRLEDSSSNVLMSGYAKLLSVVQDKGKIKYNITLNGELGKLFQEFKKITFNTNTDEKKYLVDCSKYWTTKMNRQLIATTWLNTQNSEVLNNTPYNYIGFAMNNSKSNGFDFETIQTSKYVTKKISEYINKESIGGLAIDTIVQGGLLPRQMREFRSWLQLPFIYFNKLFKIFQEKAEQITGYKFDLHSTWFNTNNPLWYNLVYMLPELSNNNETYNNLYWQSNNTGTIVFEPYTTEIKLNPTFRIINEQYPVLENGFFKSNKYLTTFNKSLVLRCTFIDDANWKIVDVEKHSYGIIYVRAKDSTNNVLNEHNYIVINKTENTVDTRNFSNVLTMTNLSDDDYTRGIFEIEIPMALPIEANSNDYKIEVGIKWSTNKFLAIEDSFEGFKTDEIIYSIKQTEVELNLFKNIKSNVDFTINNLWNNDKNIFDVILEYCKMYRIGIFVDEFEKKVKFIPYNAYFNNYTIEDWTNKVDYSKNIEIKPITFENRYLLFGYKDNNTQFGKDYKDEVGKNYGDKLIITDYKFNDEKIEFFKGVVSSIVYSPTISNDINDLKNDVLRRYVVNENQIYNSDKDNKVVDISGSWWLHNGIQLLDNNVNISDDTLLQSSTQKYLYNGTYGNLYTIDRTVNLTTVFDNYCCLFNTPAKNYSIKTVYNPDNCIYNKYWKNYLNERYNVNNKVVTCYIYLNNQDYYNFEFNKFVMINNQLYFVNKIIDYDCTGITPTKVELITIQNTNGYTNNN